MQKKTHWRNGIARILMSEARTQKLLHKRMKWRKRKNGKDSESVRKQRINAHGKIFLHLLKSLWRSDEAAGAKSCVSRVRSAPLDPSTMKPLGFKGWPIYSLRSWAQWEKKNLQDLKDFRSRFPVIWQWEGFSKTLTIFFGRLRLNFCPVNATVLLEILLPRRGFTTNLSRGMCVRMRVFRIWRALSDSRWIAIFYNPRVPINRYGYASK